MSNVPLKPKATAEFLTKLLLQEHIRSVYWYSNMRHMLKDHKRRAMYLSSDWASDYGVEKITDTEDKVYYRKEKLPYVPKKDRIRIWQYHAWWVYTEMNIANWVSQCKGHTETFYRELPQVAYKVMLRALEEKHILLFPSLFLSKVNHKRAMLEKYSKEPHKPPTHVDPKFYAWLSAICAKSLLID